MLQALRVSDAIYLLLLIRILIIICIDVEKNDPGPSPETEIDNSYRYILATEGPVFYLFPKLPQEIRDRT